MARDHGSYANPLAKRDLNHCVEALTFMLKSIKNTIQSALRRHGIDVRKVPATHEPIPVFNLAVEALMARRGDALRFVQIGANDGVFGDPLRPYVLTRGWKGLLVEPQIDVFLKLKKNYVECGERLVFENLAISFEDKLTLYLPPADMSGRDQTYAESIVSNNAKVIARQIGTSPANLRRIEVPALTLDALFEKHGIEELDLLQIDAEGYDWQVLQTMNLSRFKPHLIQLESGHLSRDSLTAVARHLNANGYLIYYGGWQGDLLAMRGEFFGAT